MKAYRTLSLLPILRKSFSLKIIFVAFIGIHVPLFGIIGYLVNSQLPAASAWNIAFFTLLMTLLATATTLFVLNKLLKPVMLSKEALLQFKEYRKIPNLPTTYEDEGGVLMREVQQTLEFLSKTNKERENVLHILKHDLQGPINNALSILELAKRDKLGKSIIDSLEESIKQQRKRLLNSIEYVKSQRSVQSREASLQPLKVEDLLKEVTKNVVFEIEKKEITISIKSTHTKPVSVPKVILDRVLTNLVDNAIKYSNKKDTILLTSSVHENILEISIKDEGPGIPEEVLPTLFKVSNSAVEAYDSKNPSMGLGLYLCQRLMHSVGGKIVAANNQPDPGATFTISYVLPK